jgi:hypothetical protein
MCGAKLESLILLPQPNLPSPWNRLSLLDIQPHSSICFLQVFIIPANRHDLTVTTNNETGFS